jgi:hypothetical protein
MGGACRRHERKWGGNIYNMLTAKSHGKRPFARLGNGEGNIKMDSKEIKFGDVDWIYVTEVRFKWRAFWTLVP